MRRKLILILSFALLVSILPLGRFLRVVPTAHAAAFTAGNLVVYRVGTGSGTLGTSAAAVFLDEYTPSGTLVQTIAMPTAVSGSNRRLTAAGSSTSEGFLTRSADGQYIVLAGYDADVGTATVASTTSATVNRVIGRVDASGTVNTSTALTDAISAGNARSAASTNGTDLWISGTSSGGGIRYATLGATTSTQISTTPTNLRQVNIFGGQLYVSSMSGTTRMATVGSGTPTTGSQTITNLTGLDSTNVNGPYGFFFADLNGGVAGNDTLYIADESSNIIRKFSLVSGTWTANGSVSATAVRGLTGAVNGGSVTLYVTSNGTTLSSLTDASGYNATITGSLTTLATAGSNTAFRGVALAPASGGGGGSTNPSGSGSATPSTVSPGDSTLLTVSVTPGTNPTSTGLAVTGNLTSIGGSSTQQFFDNGTNGDATSGDNIFSFSTTVAPGTTNGAKSLPVTITDAQARTGNTSISLTVQSPPTITAIYVIQGSNTTSPIVGQSVTTTGIVTGRKSNGYFIQDPNGDGNTNTSDALFVFTSGTPSGVALGDSVRVTGTVAEFISATSDEPTTPADPKTATELTSPTTTVLSSGNPLPAPLDQTIFNAAAASRGAELEKYEYMRVSVSSLTVSEPTNNNFGEFWGVTTGTPRPYREPGIEKGDPIPAADQGPYAGTQPPNVPIFDGNFERIMVDSDESLNAGGVRRSALMVTTGAVVTGLVGPLDYAFDNYRIVLDATASISVTPGITAAIPVPTRTAEEFTIGHANLENFGVSNAGFAGRLNKASLAIRNVMHTPDVLGMIEIFDLTTLQQLATKINNDVGNPSAVNYVAYLQEGIKPGDPNDFADDQDVGYLVNTARVSVVGSPTQYHQGNTFTYCNTTSVLHDRPAYVLNVTVPQTSGPAVPVTVILNHTKSLIASDSPLPYGTCGTGTEGARNREKRRLQAEDIADLIQTHASENLVVLGDLNAFDFNDGLGDIVGTLKGSPVPADQVVEPSTDRWTYTLTNLGNTLPASERYSFAFEGNAQALDHVLVSAPMLAHNTRFAYGRYNGDFSVDYAADTNRPERLADHDAAVAYFSFAVAQPDLAISKTADRNPAPVGLNFNYNITVTNTGSPASNTVVTDTLPSQVTLTATMTSQGTCSYDSGTRTVTCNLGTVSAGSPVNIRLTVKPREEGTLDNTASVTTSDTETSTANNSASVNGLPAVKETDLSVQKTAAPNPVFVSQNVTYTMVVKNNSTVSGATGVVLTDSLPAAMKFVSATTSQGSLITPPVGSNGIVTANLGSLGIGATATVTVTVSASAAGVITNTATVTGNESDPLAANNTDSATTSVTAVNLQKVLLAKQVLIGGCENTTGNVYLTGPAPTGGLTVALSTTSLAGVTVPASVFIPAGQMVSPAFNVTTSPVAAKQVGLVTATLGQSSVSRGLTINVGSGVCPP